jgi:hypothetical protein
MNDLAIEQRARREAKITKDHFYRWEVEGKKPDPFHVHLLCLCLDKAPEEIDLADCWDWEVDPRRARLSLIDDQQPDHQEQKKTNRREFGLTTVSLAATAVRLTGELTAALVLDADEPWERLDYVLRYPARIDSTTLTHLEQVLIVLETSERHVEASASLGAVTGHLATIVNLLHGAMSPTARRHLCSLAGETAGLAGRLYSQLNQSNTADGYFRSAVTAAHEAEDRALLAYLIGVRAGQIAYRDDPIARISLLRSVAPADAMPATRVFLAAKEADAYALIGDSNASLDALRRADNAMELVSGNSPTYRPRAPWWPHDIWLAGERGATLARLGHYDDADRILTEVLRTPTNAKHRLWLLIALSRVRIGQKEPEEAARIAAEVITLAVPIRMTTVVHEIRSVRTALSPWTSMSAIRSLDAVLNELATLPA